MFKRMKNVLFSSAKEREEMGWAINSLLAKVPSASNLLDVGCGNGTTTVMHARALNVPLSAVVGVEGRESNIGLDPGFRARTCGGFAVATSGGFRCPTPTWSWSRRRAPHFIRSRRRFRLRWRIVLLFSV